VGGSSISPTACSTQDLTSALEISASKLMPSLVGSRGAVLGFIVGVTAGAVLGFAVGVTAGAVVGFAVGVTVGAVVGFTIVVAVDAAVGVSVDVGASVVGLAQLVRISSPVITINNFFIK